MSETTVTLKERIEQLKKLQADIPSILSQAARDATIRAVETAAENTPIGMDKSGGGENLTGANTRTSSMKQSWATSSRTAPEQEGDNYKTLLANDKDYASYVNDGHRMDRHFVPGLYVNPDSGLLEYNPDKKEGIVVGTKTAYVKGEFMADKGIKEYQKTVRAILDKKISEAMKK